MPCGFSPSPNSESNSPDVRAPSLTKALGVCCPTFRLAVAFIRSKQPLDPRLFATAPAYVLNASHDNGCFVDRDATSRAERAVRKDSPAAEWRQPRYHQVCSGCRCSLLRPRVSRASLHYRQQSTAWFCVLLLAAQAWRACTCAFRHGVMRRNDGLRAGGAWCRCVARARGLLATAVLQFRGCVSSLCSGTKDAGLCTCMPSAIPACLGTWGKPLHVPSLNCNSP